MTVQIIAAHMGWFEFYLCVVDGGINDLADTCIPGYSGFYKLSSPSGDDRFVSCQVQTYFFVW